MKRLACLLVALGTFLVQVQPARATLRMPATAVCCAKSMPGCEHSTGAAHGDADMDCSICLRCCVGCAILPAADTLLDSPPPATRMDSPDERGIARRDPPPLPPPR